MGIAYFIQQHFDTAAVKFSGASGGCWPATLLAADIDVKEALEVVLEYAPQCVDNREWKVLGAYGVYDKGIAIAFRELCRRESNDNMPAKVNGRLAISLTRLAWSEVGLGLSRPYFKDEVVSEFTSNDDIVECIVASALIPFALNGKPFVRYRDWLCADGGITNVSGVRRFAAELAHDIELIEEGLDGLLEEGLEKAHRLSQSYKSSLPSALGGTDSSKDVSKDLHHAAPISSGPYGAVYIPVDIAKKVTSGLLHMCSSVVVTGANTVTSKVQAKAGDVISVAEAVVSKSQNVLAKFGITYDWLSGLVSTSSTSAISCREPNASDEMNVDQEQQGEFLDLEAYPSWPVPGMSSAGQECNSDQHCSHDNKMENEAGNSSKESTESLEHHVLSPCPTKTADISSLRMSPSTLRTEDGVTRGDSTYWRVKSPLISKIPHGGGLQLEISPWMWRHQPILNYHLSSDPGACRRLFEMGMVDAAEHHFELMKFFSPDDFMTLIK